MARGTVVGEPVVSQASTEEFRSGYERTFGNRKPQRGRWVWDEAKGRLVSADEYVPPSRAVDAPIMSGRCYEGQVAPDGTDISTRRKRAAWMRETGNADFSDFKGARERRQKEIAERAEALRTGRFKPDKQLRDHIGRELYKQKVIL